MVIWYTLTEDIATGDAQIVKDKIKVLGSTSGDKGLLTHKR